MFQVVLNNLDLLLSLTSHLTQTLKPCDILKSVPLYTAVLSSLHLTIGGVNILVNEMVHCNTPILLSISVFKKASSGCLFICLYLFYAHILISISNVIFMYILVKASKMFSYKTHIYLIWKLTSESHQLSCKTDL